MGPLIGWLGSLDVRTFVSAHLGRAPYAQPGTGMGELAACSWQELDRVLHALPPPDTLVVARGQALSVGAPRSLRALREHFAQGTGVVVRHPQHQSEAMRRVAVALSDDIPGEQRVLLFATPRGTHGFSWHYDPEDVFIVQTAGDKEYYLRQNTVRPEPERHAQPDFSLVRSETTPLMSCRLVAGDFLYIPRGWWHMAHAHEDSLSLSIGVFPDRARLAAR